MQGQKLIIVGKTHSLQGSSSGYIVEVKISQDALVLAGLNQITWIEIVSSHFFSYFTLYCGFAFFFQLVPIIKNYNKVIVFELSVLKD